MVSASIVFAFLNRFTDLAGHHKYLRTTILGLMASKPDFVLLAVSALTGVNQSTAEYFGLAGALRLPVFVVITKADCCDLERIGQILGDLKRLGDGMDHARRLISVRTEDECVAAAFHMACGAVMPVFCVSSVTGQVRKRFFLLLLRLFPCISVVTHRI